MCLADIPVSMALLSRIAQPPPLANIAVAEDGGSIDDVLANIKVDAADAAAADDDDDADNFDYDCKNSLARPSPLLTPAQECSHTLRAPCREGDDANALNPRTIANFTAKTCAWSCHWHAALEKFGLAADGRPIASAEEREAAMKGGKTQLLDSSKVQVTKAAERRRRGALVDDSTDAACSMMRVLGHGPCDLQSSAAMFLPVACVPPSVRCVSLLNRFCLWFDV